MKENLTLEQKEKVRLEKNAYMRNYYATHPAYQAYKIQQARKVYASKKEKYSNNEVTISTSGIIQTIMFQLKKFFKS